MLPPQAASPDTVTRACQGHALMAASPVDIVMSIFGLPHLAVTRNNALIQTPSTAMHITFQQNFIKTSMVTEADFGHQQYLK